MSCAVKGSYVKHCYCGMKIENKAHLVRTQLFCLKRSDFEGSHFPTFIFTVCIFILFHCMIH